MKQFKKRGRPAGTGAGHAILLRLQPELLSEVDRLSWRHQLSRQDVIRLLMTTALETGVVDLRAELERTE